MSSEVYLVVFCKKSEGVISAGNIHFEVVKKAKDTLMNNGLLTVEVIVGKVVKLLVAAFKWPLSLVV